ncbi:MAG TPA: NAD(P)-dependent oxidoreductase [Dehalococcoidia bacterium]|nr:NAD(P)-dependent oxidoreductase [Dehalococcoidia bacterium]
MKVLVLGGAGFIGPRVMRRMLDRGHEVACMDVNTNAASIADIRDRIHLTRGDITVFDDVIESMIDFKPDRVLNLAYLLGARSDGVTGDQDPHYAVKLNILGMDNAFEAARLLGIKRVVYASSLAVYGRQSEYGDRPLTEDDLRLGSGVYSVSKIFNEHQAEWYNKAYGMQITGVRPANVTGPDKERGSMDHVRAITLPASGQPVSFPFRDSMRLPIHVDDISEIFVRVTLADATQHQVYNSGGETISMGALADLVKSFLPEARISFDKEEGGRASSGNYMMDNSRLSQEFEVTLAPFRQRVMEIINEIRKDEGLPLVTG